MPDNQRIVLLTRLISRSISHAPREHKPPIIPGADLFEVIGKRQKKGFAVEFLGADDDKDDTKRLKKGVGHDCFRLNQLKVEEDGGVRFVIMLFEFIDDSQTSFPLVDLETFAGREISGKELERGASSAHVVVRLPSDGDFDDGNYRCAFEMVQPITRAAVERFINRQIRRDGEWEFSVSSIDKKTKKAATKEYRYHGKFDLVADWGRKLINAGSDGKTLSQIVFTKRSEKQSVGQPVGIKHEEVLADIEVRISGKQAPTGPKERDGWVSRLRNNWEKLGFQTKLYYRHATGNVLGGNLHRDIENASDLMLCPREFITLTKPPKRWTAKLNSEVIGKLKEILKKDDLWQRAA
jgi:hypothetical protein